MKQIKYVIGYVDSYDRIHYRIVHVGDVNDSHTLLWPEKCSAHGKFRWSPTNPLHLNCYNEKLDDDIVWKIWDIIENAQTQSIRS